MGFSQKFALLGVVLGCAVSVSAESFVVNDIIFNGLQRVSLGSVLTELSISEGETVDEENASQWLHQVYATEYFYDVDVDRINNDVVFSVIERPAIEKIEFDGNSTIPTDTLKMVFEDVGLANGEIYSQSLLESIQLELEKQYGTQGRYNAKVSAEVTALTRNRVNLKLVISEGPVAKIQHIQIVGNETFSYDILRSEMQLRETKPGKWQGFGKRNHFSSAALTGDIQRLEDYYFDRGYLDFAVESQQVSISENKADIAIVINIIEGQPYSISGIEITGDLKHLAQDIEDLVTLKVDETYSRADVTKIVTDIKDLLGENGYAFAQVRDFRQPDPATNQVEVVFQINLGYPVYVNRIIIQGNSATNDEVIRRELRQLERALVVNKNIRTSKARLERLGYFTFVNIKTETIPGRNDLVDLIVTVEEAKDSQINIAGGYADGSGFFGEVSMKQSNFVGAGIDFSASLNVNKTTQNYQLSIDNPFFTLDGVSLGTNLFYRHSNYSEITFSTYRTNSYGGRINLGYPLSENQRVSYGIGLSHDDLFLNESNATLEMTDFRDLNGSSYDIATALWGWSYNTLNGTIKADDGAQIGFNLEVAAPPGDLRYFRSTFAAQKYFNFADDFAFRLHTDLGYGLGYGDSTLLPFYKNFYAGGPRSVRGYRSGSLGPLGTLSSTSTSTASPIGGNIKVEYGAELLIPTPIVKDQRSYRTSLFVDAGNVFTDQCRNDNLTCENGIQLDEIRYSAGLDFTWITPIAPLSFSYAWPLNAQDDDITTKFSFNIGISY